MKTRTFIDQVVAQVRSGKGGDGSCSFRREAMVMEGGPDGGDGGRGGDVVFKGSNHVNSLISIYFQPRLFAENGVDGSGRQRYGRRGKDLVVPVPCGTEISDADTGELLADITSHGQTFIAARGGAGGLGNVKFKSAVNQAPVEHTPGGPAVERRVRLELKTIADAGLLGFPNAGKSSLLSAISSARPKIASYPFTTLNPIVGVTVYDDWAKVRVADVPGIIEGAARGVGLGIDFLKHLERSRVLVYVIDMAGTDGRNPWDDYRKLSAEISEFSAELAERPSIVVANKMDVPAAAENIAVFKKETGVSPIEISCAEGSQQGLGDFKDALRKLVNPPPARHEGMEEPPPPLSEMPATDGAEIPAEALKFATFLKLDPPKRKSHPSRGNIHV